MQLGFWLPSRIRGAGGDGGGVVWEEGAVMVRLWRPSPRCEASSVWLVRPWASPFSPSEK